MIYILVAIALLLAGGLVWLSLRPWLFARRVEAVQREFARDRTALENAFQKAASASGKPRGLAWKQCIFQDSLLLARDRANGDLVGLVGVTVSFEAIEGGGMEEVEAVGNLRAGTALFSHNGRKWATQGRVVFNLEPREVLERYRESLEAVAG